MKTNRITSFVVFALALLLVLGQSFSAVKAAPTIPFNASATVEQAAGPASHQPSDQSPLDISVQGRLTDNVGNPITVATAVMFRVYTAPSGGTAVLTQTATITPDANGLFTYILNVPTNPGGGDYNNVALFAQKLWLGITAGTDAEMTPRLEMSASPYAMSLAPGAVISGNFNRNANSNRAALNVFNTNATTNNSRGIEGDGPIGVFGKATSNTGGDSSGGYFSNPNNDPGNQQYGLQAYASNGWGIYARTAGPSSQQPSGAVIGENDETVTPTLKVGGYFTSTNLNGTGLLTFGGGYLHGQNGLSGYGIYSVDDGRLGTGVYGEGGGLNGLGLYGNANIGPSSDPTAIGGLIESFDDAPTSTALSLIGKGISTGGYTSPGPQGIIVRYNGSDTLQRGDLLALDGNNSSLNGAQVVGVVKASSVDSAVGVVSGGFSASASERKPDFQRLQASNATSFKAGDLVEMVTSGPVQMKVDGTASIGGRVTLSSNGSVGAAKGSTDSIGRLASKPDSNGMATVFVNFK